MNLCDANKAVSLEVRNFMLNVKDVKEESITDYLVWKWGELDRRFHYLNITTFTRHQESTTTGADFELELWIIGKNSHIPIIFQAKKFTKDYDGYVGKLNYPKGSHSQLDKLLSYALTKNKLPFYMLYSLPDKKTKTMCNNHDSDTALFMADAYKIKEIADGRHGKRISKNELLKHTNPFYCLFCCPLSFSSNSYPQYFSRYFSNIWDKRRESYAKNNENLPDYVKEILTGKIRELNEKETIKLIDQNELRPFRTVGVYDCREQIE